MKKFLTRTASGAVLLLILSSAFIVGNYYLWGLFVLISFVLEREILFNFSHWIDWFIFRGIILFSK